MHKGLLFAAVLGGLASADETWTVVAGSNWGTWEGWGVSLAWWAKAFGNNDDLAHLLFSLNYTIFGDSKIEPGLGLNIARYNAGACSNNTFEGSSMVVPSSMKESRQIDGFWWDWASKDPSSSSWNWDVDANQRAALVKAKANGANHFELFSNSPMWWMLHNRNPAGSDDGSSDNLQEWNQPDHALYLAQVAAHAKSSWGIDFESVEPFNEPIADWWKGKTGTQEGCHFSVGAQAATIPHMRSQLDAVGLTSVMVAASDENRYDQAVSTFKGLGQDAIEKIGRVNVHGYQQEKGDRSGLFALVTSASKKIWNSEYGENDATGYKLVANLILDFRWLRQTAWVYWQAVDGGGWGLINGDNDALTLGNMEQKYYALAQFSRHIREGMHMMDGGSDRAVAAYDAANSKLVIVAVNWGAPQNIDFDLSRFTTPGTDGQNIPKWSTALASGGAQYVSAPAEIKQNGTMFRSHFDTNQVQTFEISNVKI
ncbi:endo-beta-1,6-galactanase [Diaporthe helianthi]|uniref:Endo-beta-1,6-galactanase n=1 Tax=Diaporthe helianthi TaxID=158607 RepID=A0A2P5HN27_DIAHE|nr:endo-beta-1,6-galactanase [Diaporthe helianthi]